MQVCENGYLEKLHMLELKLALELKRVCEKHEIPYFLTAGTLLGAVRHGGFIPWDDDMDIGMLREDYERFIEACKQDLGEEFYLRTWDTDEDYPYSYGKLCLQGTHIVDGFTRGKEVKNNGIFIDIFPFDNVPDDPELQKRQAAKCYFYRRALWIKKGMGADVKSSSVKRLLKYYAVKAMTCFVGYDGLKARYKKIQTRYNGTETEKVVTDGAYDYDKESLKREWVTNLAPIKFETAEFLSYKAATEYLEYFYGDYMKLPPEEKRKSHGMISIDFGKYGN